MTLRVLNLILLGSLLFGVLPAHTEPLSIRSPSGATLHIERQVPDGAGPFPTVVLAPGQGYHMRLPALEQSAVALLKRGIAVYRFNWSYFTTTPRGNPSEALATELADMRAVLEHAKSDARIDASRIVVSGKSLGSIVAWRLFQSDPTIVGAVLMTPICTSEEQGKEGREDYYPGFSSEHRFVAFVLGDEDPLCRPNDLHKWALTASRAPRVFVGGGDHAFAVKGSAEATSRNVSMAAEALSWFAQGMQK